MSRCKCNGLVHVTTDPDNGRDSLGPLTQHTHQNQTANKRKHRTNCPDQACIQQLAMHPVSCQHLHNTNPCQDTSGERVKRANCDNGARVIAIELLQHTNANGHTGRCDERKRTCHNALLQRRGSSLGELGNASTKSNAFEHLMKKNDNEERDEEAVT
jgi:hypothetical protein